MQGWGEWVAGDGQGVGGYFGQGRRGNSGTSGHAHRSRSQRQQTRSQLQLTRPLLPHSTLAAAAERETRARRVYERAFRGLRDGQPDAKEEAVMLLEAWRTFEAACTSRWVWV